MPSLRSLSVHAFLLSAACATRSAPPAAVASTPAPAPHLPEEVRLRDLKQLTFDGENAEAYWSFDGQSVSMQRRAAGVDCDRIYTMKIFDQGKLIDHPEPQHDLERARRHHLLLLLPRRQGLAVRLDAARRRRVPAQARHESKGYVWALYDSYDIFKGERRRHASSRASPPHRATTPKATVCAKDGSIVFTSMRDGDIELYRMDADGKNVQRLTHTPGYDGGAFFNADCSRSSGARRGPSRARSSRTSRSLLRKGLVRPTKLELYVAQRRRHDAHQMTYLDAASFAPFWYPDADRIIFARNYGDREGPRVRSVGDQRRRHRASSASRTPRASTAFRCSRPTASGSCSRRTAPRRRGEHDTNLFSARWVDSAVPPKSEPPTAADRTLSRRRRGSPIPRAKAAASARRAGRGGRVPGAARCRQLGSSRPATGGFRATFEVTTAVKPEPAPRLAIAARAPPTRRPCALGLVAGRARRRASSCFAGLRRSSRTPSSARRLRGPRREGEDRRRAPLRARAREASRRPRSSAAPAICAGRPLSPRATRRR